jgi:HEAT repeat-containing protein 5
MSVIVPMLLQRANSEGEEVYKETSARLLDLAAADQGAFRGVVGGLSEGQKGFMEAVILKGREGAGEKKSVEGEGASGEPSIALRMDFGV